MIRKRRSGHLGGGKFTASHTTVIDAARQPAEAAEKLACVSKIALGLIKPVPNAEPRLLFCEGDSGSFVVKIRGRNSLQELRVYTTDQETTQAAMLQAFSYQ